MTTSEITECWGGKPVRNITDKYLQCEIKSHGYQQFYPSRLCLGVSGAHAKCKGLSGQGGRALRFASDSAHPINVRLKINSIANSTRFMVGCSGVLVWLVIAALFPAPYVLIEEQIGGRCSRIIKSDQTDAILSLSIRI